VRQPFQADITNLEFQPRKASVLEFRDRSENPALLIRWRRSTAMARIFLLDFLIGADSDIVTGDHYRLRFAGRDTAVSGPRSPNHELQRVRSHSAASTLEIGKLHKPLAACDHEIRSSELLADSTLAGFRDNNRLARRTPVLE